MSRTLDRVYIRDYHEDRAQDGIAKNALDQRPIKAAESRRSELILMPGIAALPQWCEDSVAAKAIYLCGTEGNYGEKIGSRNLSVRAKKRQ